MRFCNILICCFLYIFISTTPSYAQEDKLENNILYVQYKAELDSLVSEQKSITEQIDILKAKAEDDEENRDSHVLEVLRLENKIFDIRNKIGIVTSKCNVIEQEYLIKNVVSGKGNIDSTQDTKMSSNVDILINKYFVDNVSKEEINIMRRDAKIDSLALLLRDSVKSKYAIIRDIDLLLHKTQDAEIADSLFNVAEVAMEAVERYEKTLSGLWGEVFDTKIYVYNRLLDKLNVSSDIITKQNVKLRNIRSNSEEAQDTKFSPIFYAYPHKRTLVLDYEKLLAEKLVYLSSIDSLNVMINNINSRICDEEKITLPDWQFVNFAPATIGGKGVHSSRNPIKDIQIPTYGSVYMLRLCTVTNKITQITALKNINPVFCFLNENGKYEYYAGIYKSKQEAEADVARVKKTGFNPVVTQWRDGGKVVDDNLIIPVEVGDNHYKVIFGEATPEITAKLKEIAPKKEISKLDDKFSVGPFKNYLDAVKVWQTIGGDSKIVPIEK